MITNVLIIVLLVICWILYEKYQTLKKHYVGSLKENEEFKKFVAELIKQNPDKTQCIKIINAKYHIGILNAKLIIDKLSFLDNA